MLRDIGTAWIAALSLSRKAIRSGPGEVIAWMVNPWFRRNEAWPRRKMREPEWVMTCATVATAGLGVAAGVVTAVRTT